MEGVAAGKQRESWQLLKHLRSIGGDSSKGIGKGYGRGEGSGQGGAKRIIVRIQRSGLRGRKGDVVAGGYARISHVKVIRKELLTGAYHHGEASDSDSNRSIWRINMLLTLPPLTCCLPCPLPPTSPTPHLHSLRHAARNAESLDHEVEGAQAVRAAAVVRAPDAPVAAAAAVAGAAAVSATLSAAVSAAGAKGRRSPAWLAAGWGHGMGSRLCLGLILSSSSSSSSTGRIASVGCGSGRCGSQASVDEEGFAGIAGAERSGFV